MRYPGGERGSLVCVCVFVCACASVCVCACECMYSKMWMFVQYSRIGKHSLLTSSV